MRGGGGMHGRGYASEGVCMAGGAWWGVCMVGGMHSGGRSWHVCPPADTMRYGH